MKTSTITPGILSDVASRTQNNFYTKHNLKNKINSATTEKSKEFDPLKYEYSESQMATIIIMGSQLDDKGSSEITK